MKRKAKRTKITIQQEELNALKTEMGVAMERAYLPYLAYRHCPTLHMEDILNRLYCWAERWTEVNS